MPIITLMLVDALTRWFQACACHSLFNLVMMSGIWQLLCLLRFAHSVLPCNPVLFVSSQIVVRVAIDRRRNVGSWRSLSRISQECIDIRTSAPILFIDLQCSILLDDERAILPYTSYNFNSYICRSLYVNFTASSRPSFRIICIPCPMARSMLAIDLLFQASNLHIWTTVPHSLAIAIYYC